ncbi:hypothetical protein [Hydrogenimonas urashimensis]|uniref:hypothetical protein n=1 Tax=Hydrogenimonas urashimensis TaxID=2740515 RepID=UPI001916C26C|nr:hypothetical protein [Hydrogenimonas urashimensis]
MKIMIQNETVRLEEVGQLYPAAIIRYADGTVTQISLEWYDEMANNDVELLHYAICIHYKEEGREPLVFSYEDRSKLEEAIGQLVSQFRS